MHTITVTHPAGSYPIYLGEGVVRHTGSHLAELGYSGRCAVVTNATVGLYHADAVLGIELLNHALLAEHALRPGVVMSLVGGAFFLVLLGLHRREVDQW